MDIAIMRSMAGGGKTYWIARHMPDAVVCSADHYHVNDNGDYEYVAANADNAHLQCFKKYANLLSQNEVPKVVVDNTNTTAREIAPYYMLARGYGFNVTIVEIMADVKTCAARNVHGVPESTILAMYKNILFDHLPSYWNKVVYDQNHNIVTPVPFPNLGTFNGQLACKLIRGASLRGLENEHYSLLTKKLVEQMNSMHCSNVDDDSLMCVFYDWYRNLDLSTKHIVNALLTSGGA